MALPAYPVLRRKALVGGGEETTPGTAVTVSAAFASTGCYDASGNIEGLYSQGQRRPIGHYDGNADAVAGNRIGRFKWSQEIRHNDIFAKTSASGILTACGFVFSTTLYKPTTDMSARKYWTLAMWEDGRKKRLQGANGNARIILETGKPAMVEYDMLGVWLAPADETMPATSPINSGVYILDAATLTVGGAAIPYTGRIEIDLGNKIEARPDATATGGIRHFYVGSRDVTIKMATEAHTVANYDAYGLLLAGTTGALVLTLALGANTLAIAAPRLQRREISDGTRESARLDEVTFQANASSGDDELTFTAA